MENICIYVKKDNIVNQLFFMINRNTRNPKYTISTLDLYNKIILHLLPLADCHFDVNQLKGELYTVEGRLSDKFITCKNITINTMELIPLQKVLVCVVLIKKE